MRGMTAVHVVAVVPALTIQPHDELVHCHHFVVQASNAQDVLDKLSAERIHAPAQGRDIPIREASEVWAKPAAAVLRPAEFFSTLLRAEHLAWRTNQLVLRRIASRGGKAWHELIAQGPVPLDAEFEHMARAAMRLRDGTTALTEAGAPYLERLREALGEESAGADDEPAFARPRS